MISAKNSNPTQPNLIISHMDRVPIMGFLFVEYPDKSLFGRRTTPTGCFRDNELVINVSNPYSSFYELSWFRDFIYRIVRFR